MEQEELSLANVWRRRKTKMRLDLLRQHFRRLLARNGKLSQFQLGFCLIVGVLSFVVGVFLTAGVLEYSNLLWVWVGAAPLLGGILLIELARWLDRKGQGNGSLDRALAEFERPGLTAIEFLILQAIVLILFALMLDGGVRFRACLYSYVGYLAGVVLILTRRAKRLTKGDFLYLKWAWGPIIALGVPLFVRVWKAKGLI
jgi:hypothetical protein